MPCQILTLSFSKMVGQPGHGTPPLTGQWRGMEQARAFTGSWTLKILCINWGNQKQR